MVAAAASPSAPSATPSAAWNAVVVGELRRRLSSYPICAANTIALTSHAAIRQAAPPCRASAAVPRPMTRYSNPASSTARSRCLGSVIRRSRSRGSLPQPARFLALGQHTLHEVHALLRFDELLAQAHDFRFESLESFLELLRGAGIDLELAAGSLALPEALRPETKPHRQHGVDR